MNNPVFIALVAGGVGALVGGILTIISWPVLHHLTGTREEEAHRRESRLRHVQQQLGELYGPLFGLIEQINITWSIKQLASGGQEPDLDIYFLEQFFEPLHEQVISLIQSKQFLIIAGNRPESFTEYLYHAVHQRSYTKLFKFDHEAASNMTGFDWPPKFRGDVEKALRQLHEEQNQLIELTNNGSPGRRLKDLAQLP